MEPRLDGSAAASTPRAPSSAQLARRVLNLAWPVLALQFLVLIVDLSDRFLVGNLPHTSAEASRAMLAAQGTANYVAWFISSYTVLVSVGATAVVARCVGAADWTTARRATHQAIILSILIGFVGLVFGLACLDPLVRLMGLTGDAAEYAATYLRPLILLLPFRVVEVAGIACLVGAGDTRTGLWVQGGVAIWNLPLAWILCRGIGNWNGLGFVGVPWGTAICYLLASVTVLEALRRGRAGLAIHPAEFRPEPSLILRLLHVSVPAAADSLSIVAGQLWFLQIVNSLGVTAASAHGIAIGWEALGYLSGNAFGVAAMTLVGQALGARDPHRAARSGWMAFALGCLVMCGMGALFFVLAPEMFRIFCQGPGQEEVIAEGVPVLRLVAFAMPALASTMIFTSALRGAGDTRVPVLITWIGFLVVRIPLAYLLTGYWLDLGLFGAWLAMAGDLLVRGIFFALRFASGRWQHARV